MSQQQGWRGGRSRIKESQAEVRLGGSCSPKVTHAAGGNQGVSLGTGCEAVPLAFWPAQGAENRRSYHMPAPIPSTRFIESFWLVKTL